MHTCISKKLYFYKWNIKFFPSFYIYHWQGTELWVKHNTTKCKIWLPSWINFVYNKKKTQIFGVKHMTFYSSPGQCQRRAIALPPVLDSASPLALKLFKSHIFQIIWWIWFIFGVMIDDMSKIYSAITPPMLMKYEGSAINGSQDIEQKPILHERTLRPWPLTYWTQNQ